MTSSNARAKLDAIRRQDAARAGADASSWPAPGAPAASEPQSR